MNNIQLFHNEEFGQLRSFPDDHGNPWFVAKDVCAILGLSDVSMSLRNLDADEKGTSIICTPGGPQAMSTINEPGLYGLIFRSRKPEAQAFKRWITHEVIPAIRQTGQYQLPTSETETKARPGEIISLISYVVTLRQLARLNIFTLRRKADFLAEAASLLSGRPRSLFLPPDAEREEAHVLTLEVSVPQVEKIDESWRSPLFP